MGMELLKIGKLVYCIVFFFKLDTLVPSVSFETNILHWESLVPATDFHLNFRENSGREWIGNNTLV